MTVTALALLCPLALAPADCTRETAVDSIPLGTAANEIDCMMSAQMTLAALAIQADAEHRWIIVCESGDLAITAAAKETLRK